MNENEVARIKEVYKKRTAIIPPGRYSYFSPGNLFMIQSRECELIRVLKESGAMLLDNKKILDIGCGKGGELRNMVKYGAVPENLHGVDLLPDTIEVARKISPNMDFNCKDASNLDYQDSSFDIVMQFTVFTSILDYVMKQKIAAEMMRLVTPEGFIIWYDYYINNPANADVQGIARKGIYALFPNAQINLKRITLAPPLARIIAPYSTILCKILEKIPILCTHYLGIIKKQS